MRRIWGQACRTHNRRNNGKVYRKITITLHPHSHQISQEIMRSTRRIHHVEASVRVSWSCRKERDPTVKLVVACCSFEFHITAIFDDLDRRFTHRPLRFTSCGNAKVCNVGGPSCETPKIAFSAARRRDYACSRCSQSGCNMLM